MVKPRPPTFHSGKPPSTKLPLRRVSAGSRLGVAQTARQPAIRPEADSGGSPAAGRRGALAPLLKRRSRVLGWSAVRSRTRNARRSMAAEPAQPAASRTLSGRRCRASFWKRRSRVLGWSAVRSRTRNARRSMAAEPAQPAASRTLSGRRCRASSMPAEPASVAGEACQKRKGRH